MSTRDYVTKSCPAATGLLDTDFDPALLGWVTRYDIQPRAAYDLEHLVLLAAGRWEEDQLEEWIHEQATTMEPESVVIEAPPAKPVFWEAVKQGLLIWDQLTPAVCGISKLRGQQCCVYDYRRALQDLADAVQCSDEEDQGLQLFFERNIANATLGARTPLILYSDRAGRNNRLGFGPPPPAPTTGFDEEDS